MTELLLHFFPYSPALFLNFEIFPDQTLAVLVIGEFVRWGVPLYRMVVLLLDVTIVSANQWLCEKDTLKLKSSVNLLSTYKPHLVC